MAKKWFKKGDTGLGHSDVPVSTGSQKLRRRKKGVLRYYRPHKPSAWSRVARATLRHWFAHLQDTRTLSALLAQRRLP